MDRQQLDKLIEYGALNQKLWMIQRELENSDEFKRFAQCNQMYNESKDGLVRLEVEAESVKTGFGLLEKQYADLLKEAEELRGVIEKTEEDNELSYLQKNTKAMSTRVEALEQSLRQTYLAIVEASKRDTDLRNKFVQAKNRGREYNEKLNELKKSKAADVSAIRSRMAECAKYLPDDIKERCNNLRKLNRMPCVAEYNAKEKVCLGCGMSVSIEADQKIRANSIGECPNCSRLIYCK